MSHRTHSRCLFKTKKGYGLQEMQNNPQEWHYKLLDNDTVNSFSIEAKEGKLL